MQQVGRRRRGGRATEREVLARVHDGEGHLRGKSGEPSACFFSASRKNQKATTTCDAGSNWLHINAQPAAQLASVWLQNSLHMSMAVAANISYRIQMVIYGHDDNSDCSKLVVGLSLLIVVDKQMISNLLILVFAFSRRR